MFPLSLNFAALSVGAACDAWASYMDVLIGQAFGLFNLESPISAQIVCNIIDIGDFSGLLGLLPI